MIDQYDGDQRALPIAQAIAGVAESERGRPVRSLPPPTRDLGADPASRFRSFVEAEQLAPAQGLVLGAIDKGLGRDDLIPWFTGVVSDHHLSYGHAAIYSQKAFQLLDVIGWERAHTVLPHLVPTIVLGTREDKLPYMRLFVRALADVDLAALASVEEAAGWTDDGHLVAALLGADGVEATRAAVAALREGCGVDRLLDVVVRAVSERMLRYDTTGERDLHDDFGWLDITHGITYANAARWHHAHTPGVDSLRLALWAVFLAHWTGRHEWHSAVRPPAEVPAGPTDLRAYGQSLQQRSLLDEASSFIVHAHGVKTSVAATAEALRTGSSLPLDATARFLEAPKLERFVAATVTRSIDFLSGRAPRDE
jgi:hypothetical protein